MLSVVDEMQLDPELPRAVVELRQAGWDVIVTSAGCDWYIRRLLAAVDVELEVYSNPGNYVEGHGLQMELPSGSPFLSPTLGVDKAAVVRRQIELGRTASPSPATAFTDGRERAAAPVPDAMRLRLGADLADVLQRHGKPFQPFSAWSEIARRLIACQL